MGLKKLQVEEQNRNHQNRPSHHVLVGAVAQERSGSLSSSRLSVRRCWKLPGVFGNSKRQSQAQVQRSPKLRCSNPSRTFRLSGVMQSKCRIQPKNEELEVLANAQSSSPAPTRQGFPRPSLDGIVSFAVQPNVAGIGESGKLPLFVECMPQFVLKVNPHIPHPQDACIEFVERGVARSHGPDPPSTNTIGAS